MIRIKNEDIRFGFQLGNSNNLEINSSTFDISLNLRSASVVKNTKAKTIMIASNVQVEIDYSATQNSASKMTLDYQDINECVRNSRRRNHAL